MTIKKLVAAGAAYPHCTCLRRYWRRTLVLLWAVLAAPTAPAACAEGQDRDRDGLADVCEQELAARFAPVMVVSARACNWDPSNERLRGGYLFAARPTSDGVRLAYLPAYFEDCGWTGPKCLLRLKGGCDPHSGDSEIVFVDLVPDPEGKDWSVDRVFLSAHCFGRGRECRWYDAGELRRLGDAFIVWVAEGKNAHYPSKAACDAGHWHFDTCDRNDRATRFPVVSPAQNLGSLAVPFPYGTSKAGCLASHDLSFPEDLPGMECPWTSERFHGWSEPSGSGSTGYRRYLDEVGGFMGPDAGAGSSGSGP